MAVQIATDATEKAEAWKQSCQREATIKELQQQYNRATDEQQRALNDTASLQLRYKWDYKGPIKEKKICSRGQKLFIYI